MNRHFYSIARELDSLRSSQVTPTSARTIRSIIDRDHALKDYWFERLENVEWFTHLKIIGYFAPENNLDPLKDRNDPSYFSIPEWPVLPFLEMVAKHACETNNSVMATELLKIIMDVTVPPDDESPKDNSRTWWYFVKILVALPNGFVSEEILRMIPTWLTSKFHMTSVDSDICFNLLSKFLKEPVQHEGDYEKAAIILSGITTPIRKSSDTESSRDEIEYEPFKLLADDFWLSDALVGKKLARKIGKLCPAETVKMIADRLFEVVSHQFTRDYIRFSRGEDSEKRWFKIECDTSLEFKISVFPVDPEEEPTEAVLMEQSERPIYTADDFKEFFDSKLLQNDLFTRLLKDEDPTKLFFTLFGGISYIATKSFDNRSNDYKTDAEGILTFILLEMLLGRAEASDEETLKSTSAIVDEFLFGQYPPAIFTRIGLYVIGHNWDKFSDLFWRLIESRNGAYYFDYLEYEAELYSILETQSKAKAIPNDKQEILKAIIDKGPPRDRGSNIQNDYWKQTWYSALTDIPRFKEKYDQLKEVTRTKEELNFQRPSFRVGPGKSPRTASELLVMSNKEIVTYCSEFRNNDTWRDPTVNALADVLSESVRENPEKFVKDLKPFKGTTFLFVYSLLTGFRESWKNRKTFDWKLLLNFVQGYLEQDEFWDNTLTTPDDSWQASHQWIIGEVSWLLQDATVDDDWAMPEQNNEAAEAILELIITKFSETHPEDDLRDDPVNNTLNSIYGRVLTALIYLSLRDARLKIHPKTSKPKKRWKSSLKDLFEQAVAAQSPHAFVLTGQYMPQLLYLDEKWVKSKISEFLKLPDNLWYLFMFGYMFGNHQYATNYQLMIPHYELGMTVKGAKENWQELFLDHIALGYMAGVPEFSSKEIGFIGKLVADWQPDKLTRIIEQIWRHPPHDREKSSTGKKDPGTKFLKLWEIIHNRMKMPSVLNELSKEEQSLFSELTKLTIWIPTLSWQYANWLKYAAPFVNIRFNSSEFLEYLTYLISRNAGNSNTTARYLSKIYSEMLEGYTPIYKEEHIITLVSYMYANGSVATRKLTDRIVEKYARQGHHFLRETWEEHNE